MTLTAPTIDPEQRRRQGLALYRDVMATEPPEPTTPRAAALIDYVFADIWSRPGISRRDRRFIALSCAAGADARIIAADHVFGALTTGDLDVDELDELVLHLAAYSGWAKAEAFEEILTGQLSRLAQDGRKMTRRATEDLDGVPTDQEARKQRGRQEFLTVNCREAPPGITPYYDDIVDFVFGEVWTRPGLNRRDRRLISLVCVGIAGAIGPIQSHVYSAMKSGDLTYDEMLEIVLQFAAHSGWPQAQYVQQCVDEMHTRISEEESARS